MNSLIIERAINVLELEAQAVLQLKNRIDDQFVGAVQALKEGQGKVIVTGIGKSGQIGRKIASN